MSTKHGYILKVFATTTNQVRQIEHLKSLAQQKLRHKQTKNEKVTEM